MNFKLLAEKEIQSRFPKSNKVYYEGLSKEEKEVYNKQYNKYRRIFTKYIIEELNLKKYDDEINNSELNFNPISDIDMDIYQYFSSEFLKFFYLRNNIYIEKLTNEEKSFLEGIGNIKNKELDEQTREFIKQTYKKVIFEDIKGDKKNYFTFYGPNSKNYMASNDSLIIGIRYDEFNLCGLDDKKWDEFHLKQIDFLSELFYRFVIENKNKLDVPIIILQYNRFSIKTMRKDYTKNNINKNEEER